MRRCLRRGIYDIVRETFEQTVYTPAAERRMHAVIDNSSIDPSPTVCDARPTAAAAAAADAARSRSRSRRQ